MSDERTAPTPNAPRCPVCATGFTGTPGAKCPACGRTFTPPTTSAVPDLRWDQNGGRSSPLGWTAYAMPVVAVGLLLAIAFLTVAGTSFQLFMEMVTSPGVYIFLFVLLAPVLIRTIRITTRPEAAGAGVGYLIHALFASFAVAVLAGLASAVAFGIVCYAVAVIKNVDMHSFSNIPLLVGGVAGLAVYVFIFVRLRPRQKPGSLPPSPDPEN